MHGISISNRGCLDVYKRQGPTTLVSLSVSASNSGAVAASDDPASSIRDLCILQFNVNGTGFGNLRHVAKGSPASAGTFNATLLQSVNPDDKYKLVLLANLPDYGFLTVSYTHLDVYKRQVLSSHTGLMARHLYSLY